MSSTLEPWLAFKHIHSIHQVSQITQQVRPVNESFQHSKFYLQCKFLCIFWMIHFSRMLWCTNVHQRKILGSISTVISKSRRLYFVNYGTVLEIIIFQISVVYIQSQIFFRISKSNVPAFSATTTACTSSKSECGLSSK